MSNPFATLPQDITDPLLIRYTLPPEDPRHRFFHFFDGSFSPSSIYLSLVNIPLEDLSFFQTFVKTCQLYLWHILSMRVHSARPPPLDDDLSAIWANIIKFHLFFAFHSPFLLLHSYLYLSLLITQEPGNPALWCRQVGATLRQCSCIPSSASGS